jgi:hypothetical protein
MQERGIQSPETLDPFMFEKQKDYVQLKSDFILGQIPNQAIKAAREAFLPNERQIQSAAMQARPSLTTYHSPDSSLNTEQTQTTAQCEPPKTTGTENRNRWRARAALSRRRQT